MEDLIQAQYEDIQEDIEENCYKKCSECKTEHKIEEMSIKATFWNYLKSHSECYDYEEQKEVVVLDENQLGIEFYNFVEKEVKKWGEHFDRDYIEKSCGIIDKKFICLNCEGK